MPSQVESNASIWIGRILTPVRVWTEQEVSKALDNAPIDTEAWFRYSLYLSLDESYQNDWSNV